MKGYYRTLAFVNFVFFAINILNEDRLFAGVNLIAVGACLLASFQMKEKDDE